MRQHMNSNIGAVFIQLRQHLHSSLRICYSQETHFALQLNPHSYFSFGKRSSTRGYLRCCHPFSVDDFSNTFFHPNKLFGRNAVDQQHRHFQTPSPSQPKIAQNDKCQCLEIMFGKSTMTVPFIWLRDHCRSQRNYNHSTFQKIPDSELLKRDLRPASVECTDDSLGFVITWKDGHVTKFTFEFLVNNVYPGHFNGQTQRLLWDKTIIESEGLPAVSYNDHLTTEIGLRNSLTNLVKYGFTFVQHAPASIDGVRAVVERICPAEDGIFGALWTFTSDGSRGDTAFSNQPLGAHTDSTYMQLPFGIQVFQCLEHVGSGGETLLVDGFHALEILRTSDPVGFQILNKTVVPHEYKENTSRNSPGHHLYSLGTVASIHPTSGKPVLIRYNPYDRAPLNTVRPDDLQSFYEAYDKLSRIISSPGLELWLKLQPDQVLLIDNWRVLHGRAGFDGKRVMSGCYLSRDLWTSKARIFGVL